jgi:hypothetical protein
MDFSCPFLHIYIYKGIFYCTQSIPLFLSSADYALSRVDSAIGKAVQAKKKFLHAKEYAHFPSDDSALCEAERANIALFHTKECTLWVHYASYLSALP